MSLKGEYGLGHLLEVLDEPPAGEKTDDNKVKGVVYPAFPVVTSALIPVTARKGTI